MRYGIRTVLLGHSGEGGLKKHVVARASSLPQVKGKEHSGRSVCGFVHDCGIMSADAK